MPAAARFTAGEHSGMKMLGNNSMLRSPGQRNILNDAEMWAPNETWERARDLVEEASRLVHSDAKPPRTPGTVHVALTAAAFRMTDPATSKEERS